MTSFDIAALVLGSNGLWAVITIIITRLFNKKDKNSEEKQLEKTTIALLMYQSFSDKIERVLDKGFATPSDRQDIKNMHKKYKENGWNGDMDERIKRIYALPTKDLKNEKEKKI